MPLSKQRPPNTVIVELVIDRSFKDDCRANTGTIWRGQGDQNYFPAQLWPKLAEHPDVWKLVAEDDVDRPSDLTPAAARRLEEQAAARLDAERAENRRLEAEAERNELARQAAARQAEEKRVADLTEAGKLTGTEVALVTKTDGDALTTDQANKANADADLAAGEGTDQVTAVVPDSSFADAFDYAALTLEAQNKLTLEEMRDLSINLDYGIHPRTGEARLRPKFAEITAQRLAQKDEIVDTTGVDEGVVPIPKKE